MVEPKYWGYLQGYLDTPAAHSPQRDAPTVAEPFGDSPKLADELGGLIVGGSKTATCSALWAFEAEGSPIPTVGLLTIVLAGNKEPLCIIETTEVEIRSFNQVDTQFAYEEGEDDRTLASWRREHWIFYVRALPRDYGLQPAEDMPLICERFQVVYPRP